MAVIQRICLGLLICIGAADARAQPVPSAGEIFAAHSKAIGFTGALASYGTIEAHAHVTVGDREYDTEVRAKLVSKGLGDAEFTIIRDGVRTVYSDKDGVLSATVGGGTPEVLPAGMAAFIQGHQFHQRVLFPALTLASTGSAVTRSVFAGMPAYQVAGKTAHGDDLGYFFDVSNNQMLGFQLTVHEEEGPRPMVFTIGDWSTKGGETLFWRLEIADKTDLYIYEFNKILLLP